MGQPAYESEHLRHVILKMRNFPHFVRVPSRRPNFHKCEYGSDWIQYDFYVDETDSWTAVCLAERQMIEDLNLHVDEWEWVQGLSDFEIQIILDGEEY